MRWGYDFDTSSYVGTAELTGSNYYFYLNAREDFY